MIILHKRRPRSCSVMGAIKRDSSMHWVHITLNNNQL